MRSLLPLGYVEISSCDFCDNDDEEVVVAAVPSFPREKNQNKNVLEALHTTCGSLDPFGDKPEVFNTRI